MMTLQFDSFSAFLDMGGYGFFVWLSFAVTLVAMVGIWFESRKARQQVVRQILQEQARKQRIQAAKSAK
jgi:heme exporter protein D